MGVMPGLKAFVAAVLGGIGNITGAMLGGLILGMAEVMAVGYGQSTYRDAIAFIILVLILLLKPAGIMGKGMSGEGMKKWLLLVVALAVLAACRLQLSGLIGAYNYQIVILVGINIILAVSLNLINGFTGQFSIGHAGFYAVGAYTSASLVYLRRVAIRGMVSFLPRMAQDAVLLLLGIFGGGDRCRDCRTGCRHSFIASARRLPGDRDAGIWRNHSRSHPEHRCHRRLPGFLRHSAAQQFFFWVYLFVLVTVVGDPQSGQFQLRPCLHLHSR